MPHPEMSLDPATRAEIVPAAFVCELRSEGHAAAWIRLAGELDLATAPRLAQTVEDVLGRSLLIITDLRQLAFIDSAGIHAIVEADSRAREIGHRLVLIRGPEAVDRVFVLAGVNDRLDIVDLAPGLISGSEVRQHGSRAAGSSRAAA